MLQLQGVVAGYGGRSVLQGIDLEIGEGDFLGLIGPNGSGKSTLLRALTGVLPLMGGRVLLEGRPLTELSRGELARRMAVVPQEVHCPFAFSVRQVVAMGRHPYLRRFRGPSSEDERIVDEALQQTDAAHLAERHITELSGGERQRAIIARALAQRPQIMLLDEPTNHLDINHQVDVLDLLQHLNEEGLTLVCVTHDLNFAGAYCRRILLMAEGRVRALGTPREVLTAETIGQVYGLQVRVEQGEEGPRVIPLTREQRQRERSIEQV